MSEINQNKQTISLDNIEEDNEPMTMDGNMYSDENRFPEINTEEDKDLD